MTKQCPKCPAPKPESEFYVNRALAGGLTLYCKVHQLEVNHNSRERRRKAPKRKPNMKAHKPPIKDGSIDAGLFMLSLIPHLELEQRDIAFVCGCHTQYISQIEQKAKRKLRVA